MANHPVVIIGAGMAGLTCAYYLQQFHIPYIILEASEEVGGRVWTDTAEGFLLDKGFQIFLTSYPEAKRILDYEALQLKSFRSGALIRHNNKYIKLINPLKEPLQALPALFSPVGSLSDKLKILKLTAELKTQADDAIFTQPAISTIDYLRERGWSKKIIENFFRPFFGGVFLERELSTASNFFRFVFKHFAQSDATLPAQGIQAIPKQIAGKLKPGTILTHSSVKGIEGKTIHLAHGEKLQAEKIIMATDAKKANELLGLQKQLSFNYTSCVYFSTARSPLDTNMLVINPDGESLINNMCVPSDISPAYAPAGKSLISVSVVKPNSYSATDLAEKVRKELMNWFGNEVATWQHLKTYILPYALPAFSSKEPRRSELQLNADTFLCGDYTAYPSLNGAMESGRKAAEIVKSNMS